MELDIWKGLENLGNAKEIVEEFEMEYRVLIVLFCSIIYRCPIQASIGCLSML